MSLIEKIIVLYPDLTMLDFSTCIEVRNDSDGKGDYIAEWNHPTLPKPTDAQLNEVTK